MAIIFRLIMPSGWTHIPNYEFAVVYDLYKQLSYKQQSWWFFYHIFYFLQNPSNCIQYEKETSIVSLSKK